MATRPVAAAGRPGPLGSMPDVPQRIRRRDDNDVYGARLAIPEVEPQRFYPLREEDRLDLSAEFFVLLPRYEALFSAGERMASGN